jgi:hypothetical protein
MNKFALILLSAVFALGAFGTRALADTMGPAPQAAAYTEAPATVPATNKAAEAVPQHPVSRYLFRGSAFAGAGRTRSGS